MNVPSLESMKDWLLQIRTCSGHRTFVVIKALGHGEKSLATCKLSVRVDLKPGMNIPVQMPSLYTVKTNEQ